MNAVTKYLQHYAEPEVALAQQLPSLSPDCAEHVLIIPAYNEESAFFDRLKPLLQQHKVLLIIVINQPDNVAVTTEKNHSLAENLRKQTTLQEPSSTGIDNLELRTISETQSTLLLVDRFSPGQQIPVKQGVGLARKIAADIAAYCIEKKYIRCPYIFSTDCDTFLPADYFLQSTPFIKPDEPGALLFPFSHINDGSKTALATQLYEFSLNYYQAGLSFAESPYAFHTIGSTLAIHNTAYCQTRGFPKRSGGEDFYLLNKIAKVGEIKTLQGEPIKISPRLSDRVPFGTGPATKKIIEQMNTGQNFTLYNPEVFVQLKQLLAVFPKLASQLQSANILDQLSDNSAVVIKKMGIDDAIHHARKQSQGKKQGDSTRQFLSQMHTWFDSFRTLKYIHAMRDFGLQEKGLQGAGLQNVALKDLEQFPFNQPTFDWIRKTPDYRPTLDSEI